MTQNYSPLSLMFIDVIKLARADLQFLSFLFEMFNLLMISMM